MNPRWLIYLWLMSVALFMGWVPQTLAVSSRMSLNTNDVRGSGNQLHAQPATIDLIQFRTVPNLSVETLWSFVRDFDLSIFRIETVYTMGDREWFDTLYSPNAESAKELTYAIIDARRETWGNLVDGDSWQIDELAQYEAALTFLTTQDEELSPPQLFSIFLSGQRNNLQLAVQLFAQEKNTPFLSDLWHSMVPNYFNSSATATAPSNETWLPESGSVITGSSSTSGYRYITQKLKWDDKSGFKSSGDYSTYEHEFFLYNYNDTYAGTYLTTTSTAWPACYPSLKSSSHNYPASSYAYLDTRMSGWGTCPSTFNEVEYTHGLIFPSKIGTSITYTVTMTAANGTKSSDEFKLQGDIGYCPYSTSECASYLTWGVYSHGLQTRIQPDDSSWDHTVPGTKNWTE